MAHDVQWDDSLAKNFGSLVASVRKQILEIIAALEEDKFFIPNEETFVFERDEDKGIAICQHINDWGDWQLVWYYKYLPQLPSTVASVVVMLVQQPMQDLRPNKGRPA